MNSEAPLVFQANNFTVRLGARVLLSDVTLGAKVGDVLTVLGRDGSGRETLRDAITGQLPRAAEISGTLSLNTNQKTPQSRIAYLSSPSDLLLAPHVSLRNQLVHVLCRSLEMPSDEAEGQLDLAFERLTGAPLPERLSHRPDALSPRELAFALLAVTLAKNPQVVIADEVANRLDPAEADEILGLLQKDQVAHRFALISFTGDPFLAMRFGGRVAVLRDGRLVEEGTVQRLSSAQANAYTQSLFRAVPRVGRKRENLRPSPRSEPLLQVRSIVLERPVKKGPWAREGITFDLRRGASVALIGKNGSGRRSILRAVLGLAPIWQGRVIFDAVDMGVLSPEMRARLRQRIAFISGDESVLDTRMTAYETVMEPMRAHILMGRKEMLETAEAMLRRVGLGEISRRKTIAELSILDRRRVQIARALAGGPQLVVLYEPLVGLDALGQALILDLLKDFRRQEGTAFIVITANFSVAEALTEDALIIRDREIIERGPIAEILLAPKEPHTAGLIAAVSLQEPLSSATPQV